MFSRWVAAWVLAGLLLVTAGLVPLFASAETGVSPAEGTGGAASSQESKKNEDGKKPEPKKDETPKPSTQPVKRGLFVIEVDLEGVFEARGMSEIALRPGEWTTFTVTKAVPHGVQVRKGDVLVAFDTEKIDQAIADLRVEQHLNELALKQAEQQLRSLEASTPLDLAASQRTQRVAAEDRIRYVQTDRPMAEKTAAFTLKSAQDGLEYEMEELRQLEKMYKADDLTEETEEIILRRARNDVQRAKFQVEMAKVRNNEILKVDLPRRDETTQESVRRAALEWEKAQAVLPVALEKQRLETEKLKSQQSRGKLKLEKLSKDRAAMTIQAPADGVVYYGKCVQGKWTGAATAADNLRPGSNLPAHEPFLTVVQTRPMFIRATVPEKQLHYLRVGMKAVARPTGYPDLKLPASIERVDSVPSSAGKFDAVLQVTLDKSAAALMPGMTCQVELVPYVKKDALTIPPGSVAEDKTSDGRPYACILDKDSKPKKVYLTLGKRNDRQVEILQGLAEGAQVLAECPKE